MVRLACLVPVLTSRTVVVVVVVVVVIGLGVVVVAVIGLFVLAVRAVLNGGVLVVCHDGNYLAGRWQAGHWPH